MVKVDGTKSPPRENNLLKSVTIGYSSKHDNDHADLTMIDNKEIVSNQYFIKNHYKKYNKSVLEAEEGAVESQCNCSISPQFRYNEPESPVPFVS